MTYTASSPALLCLSTISWDFLWQRHQELMSRFARSGYRVLYFEPIGIRSPGLHDWRRIYARALHRLAAGRQGVRQVLPNLFIHDPILIPYHQLPFVNLINRTLLHRITRRLLTQLGMVRPILWTYTPTQTALDLIDRLDYALLVYDRVDALSLNPKGVLSSYRETETQITRKADLVFVTSKRLLEESQVENPHTYYAPAGVDPRPFEEEYRELPVEMAAVGSPRIGFFGGIDERLDLGLIDFLAKERPTWSIIFLGVIRTDVSKLKERANIFFIDTKPHGELPRYLASFDVFLLPYLVNDYTRYIYPAKIHECLATGKPTVATPLPELEPFKDVVTLATSPEAFLHAVDEALGEQKRGLSLKEQRRAVARANSWDRRFGFIQSRIAERMEEQRDHSG